jgi:hypothetical protein
MLKNRRDALEAQIASLRANFRAEEEELARLLVRDRHDREQKESNRMAMSRSRNISGASAKNGKS